MVVIKPDIYNEDQPFILTYPGVGSYNIPSTFDSDPSKITNVATLKGKTKTPFEEKRKRTFPGPNYYDVLKYENQEWLKEKGKSIKGTFTKSPRSSNFLNLPSNGSSVGYETLKEWNNSKGVTKWKLEKIKQNDAKTGDPGAYFNTIPTTLESPSFKFSTQKRWRDIDKEDLGPGYYKPEKYSPYSKKINTSCAGKSYTIVDPVMKEKENLPAPNQYSPERSRRTPPSCQNRGFTMGVRLTSTLGMKGFRETGNRFFATYSKSIENDIIGPGSYDIPNSFGTGKSATFKGPYQENKTNHYVPGPGEYNTIQNTWIKKTGKRKVFTGNTLPQMYQTNTQNKYSSEALITSSNGKDKSSQGTQS